MKRKGMYALMSAATAAISLLGMTGSAYADAQPTGAETCPMGSVCLYYNSPSYGWGSFEHWTGSSTSAWFYLGNYKFANWGSNGSGYGVTVAANAASFVNNSGADWSLCDDTGLGCGTYHSGFSGPLDGLKNRAYYLFWGDSNYNY